MTPEQPDPLQAPVPETEAQANARETLAEHFAALDAMMEADRIAHGLPTGEYRPQAVVEAELHAAQQDGEG